jgi:hypothetical protein
MKTWLTIMVLSAAAAVAAQTTTRPSAPAAARPPRSQRVRYNSRRSAEAAPALPTIYDEVAIRNIFVRGNQRPPQTPPSQNTGYNRVPTPTDLLLTGVSLTDNGRVAFLENQPANEVTVVKVGDKISSGKVVSITLDSLDYQDSSGRTIHVGVGFNLAGGDVWGVSGSGSTRPSTQPGGTVQRMPGESMDDFLRRRRAAELGK